MSRGLVDPPDRRGRVASPHRFGARIVAALLVTAAVGLVGFGVNRVVPLPGGALTGGSLGTELAGPVGSAWDVFLVSLSNDSGEPLTIERATPRGQGLDGVVSIEVGAEYGKSSVPGGVFDYWPPAFQCSVEPLRSLEDLPIGPGQTLRVALLIRAVGEGRARLQGLAVTYQHYGLKWKKTTEVSVKTRVDDSISPRRLQKEEECLRGRAEYLARDFGTSGVR